MAMWDDDNQIMLIGFVIVLIVGLNIVFAFNGISGGIVGATTAINACTDVPDGIQCGKVLYVKTPVTGLCPKGTAPVCTNACELKSALDDKKTDCAANCRTICVPAALVGKL